MNRLKYSVAFILFVISVQLVYLFFMTREQTSVQRNTNIQIQNAPPERNANIAEIIKYSENEQETLDFLPGILALGEDINSTFGEFKETALHTAIRNNFFKIANFLIQKGAALEIKNTSGDTPLLLVIDQYNPYHPFDDERLQLVYTLLDYGANINAVNNEEMTPLLYASSIHDAELIKELIRRGANINAQDKNGDTALIYDFGPFVDEMNKFLIDSGADVNIKNKKGETPLSIAKEIGNQELVDLLVKAGARK